MKAENALELEKSKEMKRLRKELVCDLFDAGGNIKKLLAERGFVIEPFVPLGKLDKYDAYVSINKKGTKRVIRYNPLRCSKLQDFGVSHDYIHYLLDYIPGKKMILGRETHRPDLVRDTHEQNIDYLTAACQIPLDMLDTFVKDIKSSAKTELVKKIKAKFNVLDETAEQRYEEYIGIKKLLAKEGKKINELYQACND